MKAHQQLKHSYLLRLYGYFHDQDNIYLMLQYAPKGKLRDFLDVKGRLEEKEAAQLVVQVVKALQFLHSHGIVHTKVNPGNILMQNKKHILVSIILVFKKGKKRNAMEQVQKRRNEIFDSPGFWRGILGGFSGSHALRDPFIHYKTSQISFAWVLKR